MDGNFKKIPLKFALDLGSSYDFDSIMHYGAKFFSSNGEETLEKLPGKLCVCFVLCLTYINASLLGGQPVNSV